MLLLSELGIFKVVFSASLSSIDASLPFFSAGLGGEGEEDGGAAVAGVWRRSGCEAVASLAPNLLHVGAHHMANMVVAMIFGQADDHLSRCMGSASSTSMSEALVGDLVWRFSPHSNQVVCPRWLVAGGRNRNLIAGGEEPGLDCFSVFFPGSFLLISKDQSVIPFYLGPWCNMYPPLFN